MKKTIIIDLDGTLFDTIDANYSAYIEALSFYGISLKQDIRSSIASGDNYISFLKKEINNVNLIEKIHNKKKEIYQQFFSLIKPNLNLIELIKSLHKSFNIVLFTTASKSTTYLLLSSFNIEYLFDLIITQEDVSELKPSPNGYKLIFNKLNINPSDCLVFEDTYKGVLSAQEAGCDVCKIYWNS